MQSFIDQVLDKLLTRTEAIAGFTFVLPSKRAGAFLKNRLGQRMETVCFSPGILSIEEFIVEITGLKSLDGTNSLFRFYEAYIQLTPKEEQEDFETFYGWAQTLIHDFNEIDRFLIDTTGFFGYLASIKDLEHWSMNGGQTDLVKNYLKFWNKLPSYHQRFVESILKENEAYQGLQYRQASEQINAYLKNTENEIIFIGFNALNKAEQKIIQTVLAQNRGQVFWDADGSYFEDRDHDAGLFMRQYKKEWRYYDGDKHPFNWIENHYSAQKSIQSIGVPKNIGQAKYVGEILKAESLEKTAVVINDEGLLLPILNALPERVDGINITMGLALKNTPPASLFETLFRIQKRKGTSLYYKDVLEILGHPVANLALGDTADKLRMEIISKNRVYFSIDNILERASGTEAQILENCFSNYPDRPKRFLEALATLTELLRPKEEKKQSVETEYLYHFNKVFKKLENLLEKHKIPLNTPTLHRIYNEILTVESIDFSGSPFDGLQIMGMLETRVLDFETVILTSVNEGVLPSGKSIQSFIPYDLKKEYGLPTYKEKDAVYAYHFYRLLQRAKKIYLLYNTEESGLNADEKSRFITQLEIQNLPGHQLEKIQLVPKVPPLDPQPKRIEKTTDVLQKLQDLAEYGFSPSALTTYIRNPIDFYKNYVLRIGDSEEVEETVALNTLGTVVHNTLEAFYKPLTGKVLTENHIAKMLRAIESEVKKQFDEVYKEAPISEGINLISFEIAKRYVFNFLQMEKETIKAHELKILQIEDGTLKRKLEIPGLDFPVFLRGRVDRVDALDGETRVIDYKTGKVEPGDLKIKDWDNLISDFKYSKAFQVLCYSSLIENQGQLKIDQAGIISFKKLKEGFMPFGEGAGKKTQFGIDENVLSLFDEAVAKLINEIFDPQVPFIEKDV